MRHNSWCVRRSGKENARGTRGGDGDSGDRLSREILKFSAVVGRWRENMTSDRRSGRAEWGTV